MVHTNRGRVILGGLLAGLVINIVEYVTSGFVLREGWGRAMQALGKPTELSPWRDRDVQCLGVPAGDRCRLAIRGHPTTLWFRTEYRNARWTGAWAIAVFLPNLANYPLGLFPKRLLLISTVVALVEIVVATLVGAWRYKEEEKVAAVRPIAA
jgi:hypothetical protein